MPYCTNCGNEINSEAVFCPHCGVQIKSMTKSSSDSAYDSGGLGWGILGFFIPLAGLILYVIWKDEKPKSAKSAGIGALIYVIFGLVVGLIYIIFLVSAFGF